MKKILDYIYPIFLLSCVIVACIFCVLNTDVIQKLEKRISALEALVKSNEPIEYDVSEFTKISAKDIESLSKDKTMVIMIGRPSCGWCAAFAPNLSGLESELNFEAYYINQDEILTDTILNEEEFNTLLYIETKKGYETFMEENLGATPITLIIRNNTLENALVGYYEKDELKTKLKGYLEYK